MAEEPAELPPQVDFLWSNQLPRDRRDYVWDYGFDRYEPLEPFCDQEIVRIAPAVCTYWDQHLTGYTDAPLGEEIDGLCEACETQFCIREAWGFQIDSPAMLRAHMEEQGFVYAPGVFEFDADHMLK
jgi:hypothetical protein